MALFRRKQLFVERGLQLRFARFVVLYMLLCSVLTASVVFFATSTLLGEKLAGIYPQSRLSEIFGQAYFVFFLCLVGSIPALFYGALVFSHRIAGPLPKIYQAIDEIGKGHFDVKLTLRKKDELLELADRINKMAERLRERTK
jgi:methyl-accepting chemotaxis protein